MDTAKFGRETRKQKRMNSCQKIHDEKRKLDNNSALINVFTMFLCPRNCGNRQGWRCRLPKVATRPKRCTADLSNVPWFVFFVFPDP